jgi:hypothetical protein
MSLNWHLPSLILHPFSGGGSTNDLLEGSSAALALSGLSRSDDDEEELQRRVLAGRYQEIRMLLFLGKDLFRWLQQCVDFMERSSDADPRISEQSFASLLVEDSPRAVGEKLERWGVTDRRAVFSRAIGVNSLFTSPPPFESLSPILIKNYHCFADHAYICFQHLHPILALDPKRYDFEIYASEEYTKMVSDQWERDAEIQGGH